MASADLQATCPTGVHRGRDVHIGRNMYLQCIRVVQLHCVLLHRLLIFLNQITAERKELKCGGLVEQQNMKVVCFKKNKGMKATDKSSKID